MFVQVDREIASQLIRSIPVSIKLVEISYVLGITCPDSSDIVIVKAREGINIDSLRKEHFTEFNTIDDIIKETARIEHRPNLYALINWKCLRNSGHKIMKSLECWKNHSK